jgi:hypothetical protein
VKTNLRQLISILTAAVVLLGSAGMARAQLAVYMLVTPPGTTVCTGQVEAGNAVIQTSPNLNGLLTITLEESATPTGPTTVLFESAKADTSEQPVIVNPPKSGEYFWRLCGTNAGTKYSSLTFDTWIEFTGGTIGNVTIPSTLQNGLTAVMPPGAEVCSPDTSISANRVGSSVDVNRNTPVAVTWFDQDTDSNEDQLPDADVVVAANLNDTVQPEDGGSILGCVWNSSSETVFVAFNFAGPLYTQ